MSNPLAQAEDTWEKVDKDIVRSEAIAAVHPSTPKSAGSALLQPAASFNTKSLQAAASNGIFLSRRQLLSGEQEVGSPKNVSEPSLNRVILKLQQSNDQHLTPHGLTVDDKRRAKSASSLQSSSKSPDSPQMGRPLHLLVDDDGADGSSTYLVQPKDAQSPDVSPSATPALDSQEKLNIEETSRLVAARSAYLKRVTSADPSTEPTQGLSLTLPAADPAQRKLSAKNLEAQRKSIFSKIPIRINRKDSKNKEKELGAEEQVDNASLSFTKRGGTKNEGDIVSIHNSAENDNLPSIRIERDNILKKDKGSTSSLQKKPYEKRKAAPPYPSPIDPSSALKTMQTLRTESSNPTGRTAVKLPPLNEDGIHSTSTKTDFATAKLPSIAPQGRRPSQVQKPPTPTPNKNHRQPSFLKGTNQNPISIERSNQPQYSQQNFPSQGLPPGQFGFQQPSSFVAIPFDPNYMVSYGMSPWQPIPLQMAIQYPMGYPHENSPMQNQYYMPQPPRPMPPNEGYQLHQQPFNGGLPTLGPAQWKYPMPSQQPMSSFPSMQPAVNMQPPPPQAMPNTHPSILRLPSVSANQPPPQRSILQNQNGGSKPPLPQLAPTNPNPPPDARKQEGYLARHFSRNRSTSNAY
jgi:hypothetical protein